MNKYHHDRLLPGTQEEARNLIPVVGNLRVPTKRSKNILQQAKGITLIESTQIRWFLI
jgi:hypothetical protein